MNEIIETYNKLVRKYKKIEKDLSENEIHDKRVILRKVFPILSAYKINPRKIKNGEKAFELFGKLRDVQVQILTLERMGSIPEITNYYLFLKESELSQKENLRKFIKKKRLQFPVIKKKSGIDKTKILHKAEKSLSKIEKMIKLWSIEDTEYVHLIRIEFKKFRYQVEVLSNTTLIAKEKLDKIGLYQDKLGEIHDYEVLIDGITKFYKKRKENVSTDVFKEAQNKLIDEFILELEAFVQTCVDVISFNTHSDMLNEDKTPA